MSDDNVSPQFQKGVKGATLNYCNGNQLVCNFPFHIKYHLKGVYDQNSQTPFWRQIKTFIVSQFLEESCFKRQVKRKTMMQFTDVYNLYE